VVPYGPEVPTAEVRRRLYDDYDDDLKPVWRYAKVEYVHAGMPTGVSLFVWLPGTHEAMVERRRAFAEAIRQDRELRRR
jgi:hypothetical protein